MSRKIETPKKFRAFAKWYGLQNGLTEDSVLTRSQFRHFMNAFLPDGLAQIERGPADFPGMLSLYVLDSGRRMLLAENKCYYLSPPPFPDSTDIGFNVLLTGRHIIQMTAFFYPNSNNESETVKEVFNIPLDRLVSFGVTNNESALLTLPSMEDWY